MTCAHECRVSRFMITWMLYIAALGVLNGCFSRSLSFHIASALSMFVHQFTESVARHWLLLAVLGLHYSTRLWESPSLPLNLVRRPPGDGVQVLVDWGWDFSFT